MGREDETKMHEVFRERLSTLPSLDDMPVFSFRYHRQSMRIHWLLGCGAGMGIGLAQIRLWPQHAIWFLAIQGFVMGYALREVLREHYALKKRRAAMDVEAEKLLKTLAAELEEKFPDEAADNERILLAFRKTMGL